MTTIVTYTIHDYPAKGEDTTITIDDYNRPQTVAAIVNELGSKRPPVKLDHLGVTVLEVKE